MGGEHARVRDASGPERRIAPAVVQRVAATGQPVRRLQRQSGNEGTVAFLARSALTISSPGDTAEREATATAAQVMRTPAPAGAAPSLLSAPGHIQRCACGASCSCGTSIQRKSEGTATASPDVSGAIQREMSGGTPLPSNVRSFMEPRFKADFGAVRVHTDEPAAKLNQQVSAHAFTVGSHIFFGRNEFQPGTPKGQELIAHELTHTVQQGAAVQRSIQREEKKSWWEELVDFGEEAGWKMLRQFAPTVVPIVQRGPEGILDWLKERASAALDGVFNAALAPVRAVAGVGQQLAAHFSPLLVAMQTAAGQIAKNDCSPIQQAAAAIERAAVKIITPIVETLQPIITKIKAFFNYLWDKIGAPILNWIKEYALFQWNMLMMVVDQIQAAANWIWDKTAWIRSLAERAWTWLKNKLGVGEGPEGQNGILQWVQRKLESAWATIKSKLEPFKQQITVILTVIGAVALAVSPVGPVLAVGAAVAGAVQGLRWLAANWGKGNIVVQARAQLEKALIPALMGAAKSLTSAMTRMAQSIGGALGNFAGALTRAAGSMADSILRVAIGAVQWVADQAVALADWGQQKLGQLADWVSAAIGKLQLFLGKVLALLKKVADVIIDIWGLPVMLAGEVWNWIPACIRDPIVDFIGPIILRQIEIFQELAKDAVAWQKTKEDVGKIIKLVFKDHDLMGAVKATFHLILRVFNLPMDLLVTVANKAMAAWDVVSKKPLQFIKNTVRSLGHGFKLLWKNITTHLKNGLQGWLFGEVKEKGIVPPKDWTDLGQLFDFVASVMGLTAAHVYELLKKRFRPEQIDTLKLRIGQVAGVLGWVNKAIDTTKSPKENVDNLIGRAKDFGMTILEGLAEWVAAKVAEELAVMAAAAAASAGLSEVLDIARRIYRAILTAVRWARRIVDMVNETLDNILDIAAGSVEKVGEKFEGIMGRGMPVIIGFLADQVGLGGVGAEIRSIVDKLRAKVDEGVLWVIDRIKAGLDALINLVKAGAKKLLQWWKKEVPLKGRVPHTLKFQGSGATAQLIVNQQPRRVTEFVKDFLTVEGTKAQIKAATDQDAVISGLQKQIVAAEAKGDQGEVDSLSAKLNDEIDKMAGILDELLDSGADEGSEKNPLQIDYPKRRASAYPEILIGPRVGIGTRVPQSSLRTAASKGDKAKDKLLELEPGLKSNTGFQNWSGQVKTYSPLAQVDLDGKDVGLEPQFASLQPGKVLVYDEKFGTGGGGKINDKFKPYGFVPKRDGGEGMDGDHVLERQLGGPDELRNLWPLDSSENRSSGSLVKELPVKFENNTVKVHEARATLNKRNKKDFLHLLVRSVRG